MVRLILLILLAFPAAAECVDAARVTALTYDSGVTVDGLSAQGRWSKRVTHWTSGGPTEWIYRDGLLPAKAKRDGALTTWEWTGRFDLGALQPGKTVTLTGAEIHGAARLPAEFKATLIREDELRIGGCRYPVKVVQTFQGQTFQGAGTMVAVLREEWIWPALGLPLRTTLLDPPVSNPTATVTELR